MFPQKIRASTLDELDEFQGKSLSLNDSLRLLKTQDGLIEGCFSLGLDGIRTRSSEPFNAFLNYYEKIDRGQIIDGKYSISYEQNKLYRIIHSSDLVDEVKLFLEFVIGLSRFVLAVQIISKFVNYLSSDKRLIIEPGFNCDDALYAYNPITDVGFFERVADVSMVAVKLIDAISIRYVSKPEMYWKEVDEFMSQFKLISDISKILASIQYIPTNAKFLSVMQTMHWRGLGGSGEIFNYNDELRPLIVHAFSHHEEYKMAKSFNKRMIVFKVPLDAMLICTQNSIVSFLNQQFSCSKLNVYDFCSGPHYTAVKSVFEKMPDREFDLTVSDVDGRSLSSLINEKEKNISSNNVTISNVYYEDLMLPMKSCKKNIEKYHLVSVNLGLHQLSIEKIYTALRYFTTITRIGGLISNLDASEKRYEQLMMIPGNIVDREGHVPYAEDMDITKLVISDKKDEYVNFAYPVVKLTRNVIDVVEKEVGVGPYMVSFYIHLQVKSTDFNKLNNLWMEKKFDECDHLLSDCIPYFS